MRKNKFRGILCTLVLYACSIAVWATSPVQSDTLSSDRAFWVTTMTQIADPVLSNLSQGKLRANMPYESKDTSRVKFAHLEAVGRLICGIAPWLELGPDDTPEGKLREKYIKMAVKGLEYAVDPQSPDYLNFGEPYQPRVDAAFLAQGLLRAPKQLWGNMDETTRRNMITELKRSRNIKPWENNWLLFASIIEASLLEFTGECEMDRLMYGVNRFRNEWYKGDALYGDGPAFHMDYYNSFVIQPMLTDVLRVMKRHGIDDNGFLAIQEQRLSRYAEQLERFISPEGTYPVVGRSIVYRFGAFHALAQASLLHLLPPRVSPEQVRCALTAVIKNQLSAKGTFDANGWLRIGFAGYQLDLAESYINTGSLYLCTVGMLALGLPADDRFWSASASDWTSRKAWHGINMPADKAIQ